MIPVVFLHGFLGSRDEWRPCVDQMKHGKVICLELPTAESWDAGLDAVMSQLPSRALLVGYSMGARVAMGCVLAAKASLAGFVFVSGNPGLSDAERSNRRAQDQAVRKSLMSTPLAQFLASWYAQPVFASAPESQRQQWIADRALLDRQRQHDLLRCFSIADQPNYWPLLHSIELPTWIVTGENDAKYQDIGKAMKAAAPQLRLVTIPQVGHAVHREAPERLAHLLDEIIETLDTGECIS